MKVQIVLNDNSVIKMDTENYSPQQMASMMNERQLNVFTLGSAVVSKNIVSYILGEGSTQPANVEIQLQNGQTIKDYVEGYNAVEYTNQINDPAKLAFVIGNNVINKNLVRMIKPIEQPAAQTA